MIAELPAYPAYKDSGVPWLGRVPAGWVVRRNGALFVQRNVTGCHDAQILEVSIKHGVRVRAVGIGRKQIMEDRSMYKRATAGDISYNMMRMWQGAVGVVPTEGLVSPAYVVARPLEGINSAYFVSLFRTEMYLREVERHSRGIVPDRNRLYWEDFKRIFSLVPPPEDQSIIVHFLGHADRRIQRLIRVKRRAIALLNEQKQAIIQRAVTQGLDPSVRRRDSGVPWLGEVPEHWEIRAVGQSGEVLGGKSLAAYAKAELRPYLRVANVYDGRIVSDDVKMMPFTKEEFSRFQLAIDDLLLNEGQSLELVGRTARYLGTPTPCAFQNSLIRVRCSALNDPRYMEWLFRSCQHAGIFSMVAVKTTSIAHLGVSRLARLLLAWPPLDEQQTIAAFLEESTRKADRVIAAAEREIALLREFRERLIADVVTGQVDVREAAARLPPLPEDEGPADLADAPDDPDDADAEPNPDDA